jgi:hypothetical protein
MSLSRRHLRRQLRALERSTVVCEGWVAWRRRFFWVAPLWPWTLALLALAAAALVEWRLEYARSRRQQAVARTARAIGWGPGPYRVSPPERANCNAADCSLRMNFRARARRSPVCARPEVARPMN